MTATTQIAPIQRSSPYPASDTQQLAAEVAKCLKLVAPSSMNAEQQTVWLHSAVDALAGINHSEVAAVSAELRRSVTRPAQIVPEISRLVAEKRKRSTTSTNRRPCPCGAGYQLTERTDVHWVEVGETDEISWCDGKRA